MLDLLQLSARAWWTNAGAHQMVMLGLMKQMGDRWVDACVSEFSGAPSSTLAHDLLRYYRGSRN